MRGSPFTTIALQPTSNYVDAKLIIEAVKKKYGIHLQCFEPKSLQERIIKAVYLFNVRSVEDIETRIFTDQAFSYAFLDEISIGLPSMFKGALQWKRIREIVKDADYGDRPLKIWHAGCSTGEEVFTMAIVLKESGIKRPYFVWATDINDESIETAKMGEYDKLRIDEFSKNYLIYQADGRLSKYYKPLKHTIKFDPKLISIVSFEYHNVFEDSLERKFDFIFCRSMMVYLDENAKQLLLEKFHSSLEQGGCLIIGSSDQALKMNDKKRFDTYDSEAKIFAKVN
jgi:chemotaxis protein methyltransferase CheR